MNDDLSHIVTLLLRLLRHRHRMTLMRADLSILRIRLVVLRLLSLRRVTIRGNAVVTLLLDLVHLAVLEVRTGAEHPGDTDEGDEEEADLDEGLARVELLTGVDLFGKGRKSVSYRVSGEERKRQDARFRATRTS